VLNWLNGAWQWVTGLPNSAAQWVTGLLSAVYTYFSNWITSVWNGAVTLYNDTVGFINAVENWAASWFTILWHVVQIEIPNLVAWVAQLYNDAVNYAKMVLSWAASEVNKLYVWVSALIDYVYQWAIDNIFNPLFNVLTSAWKWIASKGEFMYILLTHPDLLAMFLGTYLLSVWLVLARKFAPVFVRWLMHVMLSMTDVVGTILEDILTAIL